MRCYREIAWDICPARSVRRYHRRPRPSNAVSSNPKLYRETLIASCGAEQDAAALPQNADYTLK
jgi:hypothetical protein